MRTALNFVEGKITIILVRFQAEVFSTFLQQVFMAVGGENRTDDPKSP